MAQAPELTCPACAQCLFGPPAQDGELCICVRCQALLIAAGGRFLPASPAEVARLPMHAKVLIDRARRLFVVEREVAR